MCVAEGQGRGAGERQLRSKLGDAIDILTGCAEDLHVLREDEVVRDVPGRRKIWIERVLALRMDVEYHARPA